MHVLLLSGMPCCRAYFRLTFSVITREIPKLDEEIAHAPSVSLSAHDAKLLLSARVSKTTADEITTYHAPQC
jgi:hypothetical protein